MTQRLTNTLGAQHGISGSQSQHGQSQMGIRRRRRADAGLANLSREEINQLTHYRKSGSRLNVMSRYLTNANTPIDYNNIDYIEDKLSNGEKLSKTTLAYIMRTNILLFNTDCYPVFCINVHTLRLELAPEYKQRLKLFRDDLRNPNISKPPVKLRGIQITKNNPDTYKRDLTRTIDVIWSENDLLNTTPIEPIILRELPTPVMRTRSTTRVLLTPPSKEKQRKRNNINNNQNDNSNSNQNVSRNRSRAHEQMTNQSSRFSSRSKPQGQQTINPKLTNKIIDADDEQQDIDIDVAVDKIDNEKDDGITMEVADDNFQREDTNEFMNEGDEQENVGGKDNNNNNNGIQAEFEFEEDVAQSKDLHLDKEQYDALFILGKVWESSDITWRPLGFTQKRKTHFSPSQRRRFGKWRKDEAEDMNLQQNDINYRETRRIEKIREIQAFRVQQEKDRLEELKRQHRGENPELGKDKDKDKPEEKIDITVSTDENRNRTPPPAGHKSPAQKRKEKDSLQTQKGRFEILQDLDDLISLDGGDDRSLSPLTPHSLVKEFEDMDDIGLHPQETDDLQRAIYNSRDKRYLDREDDIFAPPYKQQRRNRIPSMTDDVNNRRRMFDNRSRIDPADPLSYISSPFTVPMMQYPEYIGHGREEMGRRRRRQRRMEDDNYTDEDSDFNRNYDDRYDRRQNRRSHRGRPYPDPHDDGDGSDSDKGKRKGKGPNGNGGPGDNGSNGNGSNGSNKDSDSENDNKKLDKLEKSLLQLVEMQKNQYKYPRKEKSLAEYFQKEAATAYSKKRLQFTSTFSGTGATVKADTLVFYRDMMHFIKRNNVDINSTTDAYITLPTFTSALTGEAKTIWERPTTPTYITIHSWIFNWYFRHFPLDGELGHRYNECMNHRAPNNINWLTCAETYLSKKQMYNLCESLASSVEKESCKISEWQDADNVVNSLPPAMKEVLRFEMRKGPAMVNIDQMQIDYFNRLHLIQVRDKSIFATTVNKRRNSITVQTRSQYSPTNIGTPISGGRNVNAVQGGNNYGYDRTRGRGRGRRGNRRSRYGRNQYRNIGIRGRGRGNRNYNNNNNRNWIRNYGNNTRYNNYRGRGRGRGNRRNRRSRGRGYNNYGNRQNDTDTSNLKKATVRLPLINPQLYKQVQRGDQSLYFSGKCFVCKKFGHRAIICPHLHNLQPNLVTSFDQRSRREYKQGINRETTSLQQKNSQQSNDKNKQKQNTNSNRNSNNDKSNSNNSKQLQHTTNNNNNRNNSNATNIAQQSRKQGKQNSRTITSRFHSNVHKSQSADPQ